ncbi:MAG: hypothetical protein KDD45_11890, partial [Bdellovibrionales bacterium]|nr:hypothetical protein [Bdellovibrionales bacterium]
QIKFNYYDCRRFFKGYVVLKNDRFNFKEKIEYYVEPWEPYTLGTDKKQLNDPKAFETSCNTNNPKKSEIVLEDMKFTYMGQVNDGRIKNKLLEMNISRHIDFALSPKVNIPSNIDNDYNANSEPLANGVYLLRVAIFKNFVNTEKPELIAQKDLPVLNAKNIIHANFDFFVKDKRLLDTKNTVLLQLLPVYQDKFIMTNETVYPKDSSIDLEQTIDKTSKLLSPIYRQEVSFGRDSSTTLKTFSHSELASHYDANYIDENKDFNLSLLIKEFKKNQEISELKDLEKSASPEVFANINNLSLLYKDQALKSGLNLDQNSQNVSRKICDYWFNTVWKDKLDWRQFIFKNNCLKAADKDIKKFFSFENVYFVNHLNASKFLGIGFDKSLTVASNFGIQKSVNEYTATQMAAKIALKFDIPFKLPLIGLGGGSELAIASGHQSNFGKNSAFNLSESTSLQVSEHRFQLSIDDYKSCTVIKPRVDLFYDQGKGFVLNVLENSYDFSSFFKSSISNEEKMNLLTKGIIICSDQNDNRPLLVEEKYYWVRAMLSDNEMQDSYNETTRNFSILIRGYKDFLRFKHFLTRKWHFPDNASNETSDSKEIFKNLLYINSFEATMPGVYIY